MRKEILFYADGNPRPFSSEEEALKEEARQAELAKRLLTNSPHSKLDNLKRELDSAMFVPYGTIATCSYEALTIKGMVRVCAKFAEDNKEYLSHY